MTDDSSLETFVGITAGGKKGDKLVLCYLNCLLCVLFNEIRFVQG